MSADEAVRRNLRILIVEDSPDDALLVQRYLTRAGYNVIAERVESAAAMQHALKNGEWDVIISDYTVPGFGALPALELLSQTGLDIPFIIMSGTSGEETAVAVMRAGAHDYILKDKMARMVPAIERELHEAAARRQKREMEAALLATQERFRATFNQAAVGMAHVSLDGTWLMVNQRFCDLLGCTRDELLGHDYQQFTHPDDVAAEIENTQKLLRRECESYAAEKRYIRKNGTVVQVNLTRSVVRDAAGDPKYFIAVVEDISRRKAAEAERARLTQMLISSEKLAAAGRMAGMLAHEINNPLAAVVNVLWLLQERPDLPADARTMVELANSELNRVSHITRSTLSFYRESPVPITVNVAELLREILQLYERRAEEQQVILDTRLREGCTIMGHPGALRQVFSNLIGNAMEAMPEGGRLSIRCKCSEGYARGPVTVLVADTGIGIDRANRPKLFEPFFTTKGEKGTGLGLWVSRGIIEKHNGKIMLRSSISEKCHGTVFKLLLPADGALPNATLNVPKRQ